MKVLKQGTGQTSWSRKVHCTGSGNEGGGCGALLQLAQEDLYKTYHSYIDGSSEEYVTFSCCLCKVETDLRDVPLKIRDKLPTKEAWLSAKRDKDRQLFNQACEQLAKDAAKAKRKKKS